MIGNWVLLSSRLSPGLVYPVHGPQHGRIYRRESRERDEDSQEVEGHGIQEEAEGIRFT